MNDDLCGVVLFVLNWFFSAQVGYSLCQQLNGVGVLQAWGGETEGVMCTCSEKKSCCNQKGGDGKKACEYPKE